MVFVNAIRQSHRVGIEVVAMTNALVDQELLNHPPWVREADGQPASKKPKTKVEVMREDAMSLLRPSLMGNEERKDTPKVFFDADFSNEHRSLLDHN